MAPGEPIFVGKGGFTELFTIRTNSEEWRSYQKQMRQIIDARRATEAAVRGNRPPQHLKAAD